MDRSLEGKSVVVLMPTFNDWRCVAALLPEIDTVAQEAGFTVHLIVADDASYDLQGRDAISGMTFTAIRRIDQITMTRNQGNQRTLAISIAHTAKTAEADYLIVMDSDHQDKPRDIPRLILASADKGDFHIAFAERAKRSEGLGFRICYGLYQLVYRALTGHSISMGNFSAVPWTQVTRLANVSELWNHYAAGIVRARLPYTLTAADRGERLFGDSKMNLVSLVGHAMNGYAVFADVAAVRIMIFSLLSAGLIGMVALVLIGLRLFSDIPLLGWTSTILGLLLVVVVQVLTAAGVMSFVNAFMRMQSPLIPAQEFQKFILSEETLYSSKDS